VKIENSFKPVGSVLPGENRSRAQPASESVDAAEEQVGFSSLASSLQKGEAAAASASVVNSSRVAEIRKAISEGRYQVNPERIAEGLMDSVRDLLSAQTGKA